MQGAVKMVEGLIPAFVCILLIFALFKRVNAYDAFINGAGEAIKTVVGVFPSITAMMIAVSLLDQSGMLQALTAALRSLMGEASALLPIMIIRPLSGSGALSVLTQTIEAHGVDSNVARTAAVMMGSSETIFYTLSLYLGTTKIKKGRYVLPVALVSGATGMCVAIWITPLL